MSEEEKPAEVDVTPISFLYGSEDQRPEIVDFLCMNDPKNEHIYRSSGKDILLPPIEVADDMGKAPQRVCLGDYITLTEPFIALKPIEMVKLTILVNTIAGVNIGKNEANDQIQIIDRKP